MSVTFSNFCHFSSKKNDLQLLKGTTGFFWKKCLLRWELVVESITSTTTYPEGETVVRKGEAKGNHTSRNDRGTFERNDSSVLKTHQPPVVAVHGDSLKRRFPHVWHLFSWFCLVSGWQRSTWWVEGRLGQFAWVVVIPSCVTRVSVSSFFYLPSLFFFVLSLSPLCVCRVSVVCLRFICDVKMVISTTLPKCITGLNSWSVAGIMLKLAIHSPPNKIWLFRTNILQVPSMIPCLAPHHLTQIENQCS